MPREEGGSVEMLKEKQFPGLPSDGNTTVFWAMLEEECER